MSAAIRLLLFVTPLVWGALIGVAYAGVVRVDPVFSDRMVVQRDTPVRVWGTAESVAAVRVTVAGQSGVSRVDADGGWMVELPPLPATPVGAEAESIAVDMRGGEGEPWVRAAAYTDVLFGDVWVASGQSNMAWPLSRSSGAEDVLARLESDGSFGARIRVFTSARRSASEPMGETERASREGWAELRGEAASSFSGVAAHFALSLREHTDIPLGLIGTYWGGTRAEFWTPGAALAALDLPDTTPAAAGPVWAARTARGVAEPEREAALYERQMRELFSEVPTRFATQPTDGPGWSSVVVPGAWSGELEAVDGVRWYRRTVVLPEAWRGAALTLRLGRIDDFDQTYVNGELVGATLIDVPRAHTAERVYRVPGGLTAGRELTIAVRVIDHWRGGGFTSAAGALRLSPAESAGADATMPLAGPWRAAFEYRLTDDPGAALPPGALEDALRGGRPEPSSLWNGMVHSLTRLGISGVLWYQGEAHRNNPRGYGRLFSGMIESWRDAWSERGPARPAHLGGATFPFYFVQLAGFLEERAEPGESGLAEVRELQRGALALPATGMATAVDLGDAEDIHPRDKRGVGRRLALWALAREYGVGVVPSGPLPKDHRVHGSRVIVGFDHGAGLGTSDGSGRVSGVAIRGARGPWRWANAGVHGDELVCWHPEVRVPAAVRYAWADNPAGANLINGAGLPASPFELTLSRERGEMDR